MNNDRRTEKTAARIACPFVRVFKEESPRVGSPVIFFMPAVGVFESSFGSAWEL
ncbi:MAG: hypothetical protein IJM20_07255 [Clostridia bacterium]|jgi:hypothetical protein|nr:hypothetical protein [Clostridia bacterium]